MRVLLVEDSPDLRYLFARVLKGNGFEVCEAANSREALACLPVFEPEIIVTDLMMPELDGFEFIRRVRSMPSMLEVPIVVMTAAATDETESKVRRAGVAEFLEKPFDTRALLSTLKDFGP